MNCDRVAEILPWFLNGTLEEAERETTRTHLAQCPQCRRELEDTKFALSVVQPHLPIEALVKYAFDDPMPEAERELIERHLAACRECSEQFALSRESYRLQADASQVLAFRAAPRRVEAPPPGARTMRLWQYGALAASLLGLMAIGGWLWSWRQSRELQADLARQRQATDERVMELQTENQRLRQPRPDQGEQAERLAQLQARVKELAAELAAPQINLPILEVYPREMTERGGQPVVTQLMIPANVKTVALILNSQSATEARGYSLEILDAQNRAVAASQGLARHPTGDYTVSLPVELLPPGGYTLNVYGLVNGKRVKIESYRIQVNRARR